MSDEKVYVKIIVLSTNITAEIITEKTRIKPDQTWKIGGTRPPRRVIEKNNGWLINSKLPVNASLEDHVGNVLTRIKKAKTQFRGLSRDNQIVFLCAIYTDHYNPQIFLDKNIINFISDIGADLNIDIYALGESE